jgi:hypothetical protein
MRFMKSSRRVLDEGVLEVVPDAIAVGGDKLHVLVSCSMQLVFRANWNLRANGVRSALSRSSGLSLRL